MFQRGHCTNHSLCTTSTLHSIFYIRHCTVYLTTLCTRGAVHEPVHTWSGTRASEHVERYTSLCTRVAVHEPVHTWIGTHANAHVYWYTTNADTVSFSVATDFLFFFTNIFVLVELNIKRIQTMQIYKNN